jgi:hypothetical protein
VNHDLSYSEKGRVWADYLERVNKTIVSFAPINQACEDTIKLMIFINSGIFDAIKIQWGKRKLPNHQVFVSIYYKRNITYLQSSHALACIGFLHPSSNLNRTVFETLLRGYLFIVEPKEADEYFRVIGTKEEESYNIKKGPRYLREELYSPKMRENHKKLYKLLCISAHPDIKGAEIDYPKYLPNRIRENLMVISFLMYGNIQMMAECFFDFLTPNTRAIVKNALENIANNVGSIPLFESDREPYASKLRLKKGNFLKVL